MQFVKYKSHLHQPPFYSQNVQTMYDKIAKGDVQFPEKFKDSFDPDTRSIILGVCICWNCSQESPVLGSVCAKAFDGSYSNQGPSILQVYWLGEAIAERVTTTVQTCCDFKRRCNRVDVLLSQLQIRMVDPCFTRQTVRLTQTGSQLSPQDQQQFESFTPFSRLTEWPGWFRSCV